MGGPLVQRRKRLAPTHRILGWTPGWHWGVFRFPTRGESPSLPQAPAKNEDEQTCIAPTHDP